MLILFCLKLHFESYVHDTTTYFNNDSYLDQVISALGGANTHRL